MSIRSHLPPRNATLSVFAWLALFVFSYTIVHFFWYLPSWLEYLPAGEIFAIAAYACALALIECLALLAGLLLLAALLPGRWLRERFSAQGTLIFWGLALWAALLQLALNGSLEQINRLERLLPGGEITLSLLLLTALALSLILAPYQIARRFPALERLALSERVSFFLYIYVPLGLIGLAIVILRNTR